MKDIACNTNKNITKIEAFILLITIMMVPSIVVIFNITKNPNFNFVNIVSISFSILLITIILFAIITKRPYLTLFFGCHTIDKRSFKIVHKHLGLCARCFGILLGMILMSFISLFDFNYIYLVIGIIPLIIDGYIQKKYSYESNNFKRITSGILFGLGFMVLLSYFYYYQIRLIIYIGKLILK